MKKNDRIVRKPTMLRTMVEDIISGLYSQSGYSRTFNAGYYPKSWVLNFEGLLSEAFYRYPELEGKWFLKLIMSRHDDFINKNYPFCRGIIKKYDDCYKILQEQVVFQLRDFNQTDLASKCDK